MAKWFHTRVREARERAELSQAELAAKLGVSGATISNWENRVTEPWDEQRERVLEWVAKVEKGGIRRPKRPNVSDLGDDDPDDPEPDRKQVREAHRALRNVYEYWPQARIAEALNVSQATVSNWLRSSSIASKYLEAIRKLENELAQGSPQSADGHATAVAPRSDETPYADWLRAELEQQDTNAVELAQRSGVNVNTILNLLEGRTEKPQQRTRQRIEAALPVKPSSEQTEAAGSDPWYYIGLDWSADEIDQVPDEPGVYIIHDRLGRPAYIGVAYKGKGGIRARLRKHNELRWTSDNRVARSFSYALSGRMPNSDPSQLAKSLEKLLIKFMGNAILINEREVEDLAS
jgi:transcriptional regulator with XRE-family HTH domain